MAMIMKSNARFRERLPVDLATIKQQELANIYHYTGASRLVATLEWIRLTYLKAREIFDMNV